MKCLTVGDVEVETCFTASMNLMSAVGKNGDILQLWALHVRGMVKTERSPEEIEMALEARGERVIYRFLGATILDVPSARVQANVNRLSGCKATLNVDLWIAATATEGDFYPVGRKNMETHAPTVEP